MLLVLFLCVFTSAQAFYTTTSFLNEWDRVHDVGPWVIGTKGSPWPKPHNIYTTTSTLGIEPKYFKFRVSNYSCDILKSAIRRYKPLILSGRKPPRVTKGSPSNSTQGIIKALVIILRKPCENWPQYGMDESYTLDVGMMRLRQAILVSDSIWGILRGLETFSQLVWIDKDKSLKVNKTSISDFPRFSHRGILLDTSRHYLPLRSIKDNLDLMAFNKFNTFHWHIVDDNSFPYQSIKFPNISKKGAYSPKLIYTPDDVTKVLEYARLRGIRVMPEFDTPGHTSSWGPGEPELLTQCYDIWGDIKPGVFGPVDPSKNSTYIFMKKFFKEITKVFPDNFIHLGGDEVEKDCWRSNPGIKKFMWDHNISDPKALEEYYIKKLANIVKSEGRNSTLVVWQEVFDNAKNLDKDMIIHVWKGENFNFEMYMVANNRMRALLSSCWYLNYISYGIDWHKHYTCDPTRGIPEFRRHQVIGGEAAMWGEFVDETNLTPRLWPRAAAVAERLWSSRLLVSPELAAPRMEEHRCRMRRRGYAVQPATGSGFCP